MTEDISGSLFVRQMESTNQQQTLLVGNSVMRRLMIMEVLLVWGELP
jgi:hypothetical protein